MALSGRSPWSPWRPHFSVGDQQTRSGRQTGQQQTIIRQPSNTQ